MLPRCLRENVTQLSELICRLHASSGTGVFAVGMMRHFSGNFRGNCLEEAQNYALR